MEYYMMAGLALMLGTAYGLIIGIIPAAGAMTGLVALFPFLATLQGVDPYLAVIFIVAAIASSTTGDTFTSVILGIPGANSAAATMVDGFPLAQQGKAAYALSAAVTTSTVNGLFWGALTFLFLPYYYDFVVLPPTEGGVGQAELWALCVLAFVTVGFVSTKFWVRSMIALAFGVFLALIGTDPVTAEPRFTFGWEYLQGNGNGKGMSLIPVIAGLFAMPELLLALRNRALSEKQSIAEHQRQVIDGIKISFKEWKLSARGGLIGAVIGFLPGLGGGMSDWMAYGQAVATNPNEKIPFGKGNIKGVIGPEGSNNAQKASSFIPTVLFGIPGAPFAAIVIALFTMIGFDLSLDTQSIIGDQKFFNSMSLGFLAGTLLTGIICLSLMRYLVLIAHVPYKYYFPVLIVLISWACYTAGFDTFGWENVLMLWVFAGLGLIMKKWWFSRPALMIGFILGDKIEQLSLQVFSMYNVGGYPLAGLVNETLSKGQIMVANRPGQDLLEHPLFVVITFLIVVTLVWGYKNRGQIDYA